MKKKNVTKKAAPEKLPRVKAASGANIVAIRKQATQLSNDVQEFTIESPEDVQQATDVLVNIKKATELIEANKAQVIDKLNDLIKIEKERWQPSLDLLGAADSKLRVAILEYRKLEQLNAKKEEGKVLKAVASGRIKNETTAMAKIEAIQGGIMSKSVKSSNGGATASFRTLQKLCIDDVKAIPREYMTPDRKAIEKALKDGEDVPGCRLVSEETLAIK